MAASRYKNNIVSGMPKAGPRELPGSVQMFLLTALTIFFVSGGGYLYSVNQSAVQGYHMRTLEKEINTLKQQNAELRITEADLRSLSRIEASQDALQMQRLGNVKYIEQASESHAIGSVALR